MSRNSGASGGTYCSRLRAHTIRTYICCATCATIPALPLVRRGSTATEDLLAAIGPAADFAGAPCVGRWSWFDPPGDHEPSASVRSRHEAAVHLCATCPLTTLARYTTAWTRCPIPATTPPIGVKVTATRRLSRTRPIHGGLASPFLAATPPAPPRRRGSCSPEHTPAAPRPPHKCSNPEKRNTE